MIQQDTAPITVPDDRPPEWANSIMRWAITTKGIESWVGTGVALLTFKGRRTGKTYSIPVSYQRDGDTVTIVTKRIRRWWHNFETPTEVVLRLAGKDYDGTAIVQTNEAELLEFMTAYLEKRPVDAKAYGLKRNEVTRAKIAQVLPHIVVIRIEVSPVQ
jgi:hypothetical protein